VCMCVLLSVCVVYFFVCVLVCLNMFVCLCVGYD